MKVDYSKARTICEEYCYWYEQFNRLDPKLPWDKHPNELRQANRRNEKILKKLEELIDSEEFKEHNCF